MLGPGCIYAYVDPRMPSFNSLTDTLGFDTSLLIHVHTHRRRKVLNIWGAKVQHFFWRGGGRRRQGRGGKLFAGCKLI